MIMKPLVEKEVTDEQQYFKGTRIYFQIRVLSTILIVNLPQIVSDSVVIQSSGHNMASVDFVSGILVKIWVNLMELHSWASYLIG